ncbi:MAG TPA: hypothetical protein VLD61_10355 [Methylomirabilota bacterium]|nr:hypothetical protein [Methylomirabilota bacterium]
MLGRILSDLVLLTMTAAFLLAPAYFFLRYRLERAVRLGQGHRYVPLWDPWLPAITALSGVGLIAILRLVG